MYCLVEYKVNESKDLVPLFHFRSQKGAWPIANILMLEEQKNWSLCEHQWSSTEKKSKTECISNGKGKKKKRNPKWNGMFLLPVTLLSGPLNSPTSLAAATMESEAGFQPLSRQLFCYSRSRQSTSLSKTHQPLSASWKRHILLDCKLLPFISLPTTHLTPEQTFHRSIQWIICPRNHFLEANFWATEDTDILKPSTRWQHRFTSLPCYFSHQRQGMG